MRAIMAVVLAAIGIWMIVAGLRAGRAGDEYIRQGQRMMRAAEDMRANMERGD